jgi:hypothetical protein
MVVVVLGALVGALLAGVGAQFRRSSMERRVARTHPGALRGEVGDIPTQPETPGHLLAMVSTFVGAPLTRLSGLEAAVYTPVHLVGQVVDLCERHCTRTIGANVLAGFGYVSAYRSWPKPSITNPKGVFEANCEKSHQRERMLESEARFRSVIEP